MLMLLSTKKVQKPLNTTVNIKKKKESLVNLTLRIVKVDPVLELKIKNKEVEEETGETIKTKLTEMFNPNKRENVVLTKKLKVQMKRKINL